jgi:hypothetical protein
MTLLIKHKRYSYYYHMEGKRNFVYFFIKDYIITGKCDESGGVKIHKIEHFNALNLKYSQGQNKLFNICPHELIESVDVDGKKYTCGETASESDISDGFASKVELYLQHLWKSNFLNIIKQQRYTGIIKIIITNFTNAKFKFRNGMLKYKFTKNTWPCIKRKTYFYGMKSRPRFQKIFINSFLYQIRKETGGIKMCLPPPKQTIISYLSINDPYFRIHCKLRSHVMKIK